MQDSRGQGGDFVSLGFLLLLLLKSSYVLSQQANSWAQFSGNCDWTTSTSYDAIMPDYSRTMPSQWSHYAPQVALPHSTLRVGESGMGIGSYLETENEG